MIRLPTLDDTLRSLCKRADISGISGVPSVTWSTVGDWLGGADRWDDSVSQVAEKAPSSPAASLQQNLPATTKQLPPGVSPVQNSPASVIKPPPGESFVQNMDSPQMKATGVADSALTMPNGLSPAASQAAFAPSNFTMSQVGQLTTPPAPAGLPPGASIADAAGGSVLGSQGVPPAAPAAKQPGDLTSAPAAPAVKAPAPALDVAGALQDQRNGITSRGDQGSVGFQSGAGIYGTGGGNRTLVSPYGTGSQAGAGSVVQKPAGTFGDPKLVAQTNALRGAQYAPGGSMAQVGSLTKPPATPAAPVIPPAAAAQADSAWQNMKTIPLSVTGGRVQMPPTGSLTASATPKPSIGSTSPMGKGSIKPTGFNM